MDTCAIPVLAALVCPLAFVVLAWWLNREEWAV